jgi:hypothetical protein
MASDRDSQAARLRRKQWSYTAIAEHLGYLDRRAAHRGVLRGLAELPAEEAQLRAVAVLETDERLRDLDRCLWALLERHEPYQATVVGARVYLRIIDALFRVSVERCRLHGLFVHPWRCDQWWRRDVPMRSWWDLHRLSAELERQARVPQRFRPTMALKGLAPVVRLRPVLDLDPGMESLVRPACESCSPRRRDGAPSLVPTALKGTQKSRKGGSADAGLRSPPSTLVGPTS